MKSTLTILLIALISLTGWSQKVKIKDDIALVNGKPYIKWVKHNMANEASVYELNSDNEIIFVRYKNYTDPNQISRSNQDGKVRWVEFNFLTLNLKCEVSSRMHRGLVKLILDNQIFVNGKFNPENADKFVRKYGTEFSDARDNTNVNIIINN